MKKREVNLMLKIIQTHRQNSKNNYTWYLDWVIFCFFFYHKGRKAYQTVLNHCMVFISVVNIYTCHGKETEFWPRERLVWWKTSKEAEWMWRHTSHLNAKKPSGNKNKIGTDIYQP